MDSAEAQGILSEQLASYVQRGYADLARLVTASSIETTQVLGGSGTCYQVEIVFVWDDQPDGDIRILGSVDDGGFRAFVPLARSELVSRPEGIPR
jgi:hypothetical protein